MQLDPFTKLLIRRENASTLCRPTILMYHGITSGSKRPGSRYDVSSIQFRRQMDFLQYYGWTAFCVKDLLDLDALPPRSVFITFDDGYKNNFDNAFLELVDRGMCATWFIVSDCIGKHAHWMGVRKPDTIMLDDGQIREMIMSGMEIGSHTNTHPKLSDISLNMAANEIHNSKLILEDIFETEIMTFAYPYGKFNEQVKNKVSEAGYSFACSVRPGWVDTQLEKYQLRRVSVFANDNLGMFARKLLFASNDTSWSQMARYAANRTLSRIGNVFR